MSKVNEAKKKPLLAYFRNIPKGYCIYNVCVCRLLLFIYECKEKDRLSINDGKETIFQSSIFIT